MAKSRILRSKATAWLAFTLILIVLVTTFKLRTVWWNYFDIFFIFMMVFCHLISVVIAKVNKPASDKLDFVALIMGILGVLALIAEAIAWQCL